MMSSPHPAIFRATAFPMLPNPMIPSVLPMVRRTGKDRLISHAPSRIRLQVSTTWRTQAERSATAWSHTSPSFAYSATMPYDDACRCRRIHVDIVGADAVPCNDLALAETADVFGSYLKSPDHDPLGGGGNFQRFLKGSVCRMRR